jgi:hypothetical protein
MIIRAIRYIINTIFWQFIFNQVNRVDFIALMNNFSALFLTLSARNVITFLKDLILNSLTNNFFFRLIPITNTPGFQVRTLTDTPLKRVFWFGFIFTLLVYRWFILFKRLLLWPFKLGIFTFIFSTIGIDVSWLLGWFNFFPFTIPQLIYVQYLSLFNNWLGWWKGTVNTNISLPKNPRKELVNYETSDLTETNNSDKIFNRKNIIILISVLALVGVGVWYFYYNSGSGGAGGTQAGTNQIIPGNPPAPNVNNVPQPTTVPQTTPVPQAISITDNQTGPNRFEVLDRLDNLRYTGRVSRLGDPLSPSATNAWGSASIETPIATSTETVAEASSSTTQAWGSSSGASTTRTSPTHTDPMLAAEYDRLFPRLESQAEASSSTPIVESASNVDRPESPPIERSASPTGSTDSSETVTHYTDPKGKTKFIFRNNS